MSVSRGGQESILLARRAVNGYETGALSPSEYARLLELALAAVEEAHPELYGEQPPTTPHLRRIK